MLSMIVARMGPASLWRSLPPKGRAYLRGYFPGFSRGLRGATWPLDQGGKENLMSAETMLFGLVLLANVPKMDDRDPWIEAMSEPQNAVVHVNVAIRALDARDTVKAREALQAAETALAKLYDSAPMKLADQLAAMCVPPPKD